MVVFNCNACGESMKKNQVEKHYRTQCPRCNVLSCVDCGKEFWGNDYEQHTKCITEDEKYGGKNYKPKPGANKGEAKQELWIQQVQEAIDKAKGNPKLRGLLEKMKEYPNIPRKKAKFENFLKNSLRIRETWLISQVWELLAANMQQPPSNNSHDDKAKDMNGNDETETPAAESTMESTEDEKDVKKSKRERKEERRQKQSKKEKKDKLDEEDEGEMKRNKKRKRSEVEEEETVEGEKPGKKKKKKKKDEEDKGTEEAAAPLNTSQISVTSPPRKKFSWEATILEVLRKNNNELKIKKLRKKVLNDYLAHHGEQNHKSEEQLWSKFDKKIRHTNGLKVQKERVTLVES